MNAASCCEASLNTLRDASFRGCVCGNKQESSHIHCYHRSPEQKCEEKFVGAKLLVLRCAVLYTLQASSSPLASAIADGKRYK